jgi:hypothetical protein
MKLIAIKTDIRKGKIYFFGLSRLLTSDKIF